VQVSHPDGTVEVLAAQSFRLGASVQAAAAVAVSLAATCCDVREGSSAAIAAVSSAGVHVAAITLSTAVTDA
jgi:hypothetical protein